MKILEELVEGLLFLVFLLALALVPWALIYWMMMGRRL